MRALGQDEIEVVNGGFELALLGTAITVLTLATATYMPPALAGTTVQVGVGIAVTTALTWFVSV